MLKLVPHPGKTVLKYILSQVTLQKKLVHFENIISLQGSTIKGYSFPIIRMSDLYLNYAEALNETKDSPDAEVYEYIQAVRYNAGLDLEGDLLNTWAQYSNNPGKPTTKEGMREIIRQERMVELALEGYRYWDLRRWKLAEEYLVDYKRVEYC